ncbi:MAG TPA: hypothetical protein VF209_02475, partial [Patescibacteria group bacterium]
GAYLIMEYDPETDTIYRLSTEPLSCATSAAMVDNNLYIACHEVAGESSKIYKVNLESGEIIARYNDVELTGQSRVNLKLLSQDNWLWGASDEGIFRIDTKTTRIDTYNHAALQMPVECLHPAHIYFEYDQLKVLYQNCDRVSAYQAESDTWVLTDEVGELPTKINLSEKDFGLDLPYFMGYTRIVENKRYLFADSGLYVTTASTLPKKIFSWEIANPPDSINPEAYVTPDGALALFIGQAYDLWYLDPSKTPTLEESLFLYLVDLTTGESTNLVPIHPQAKTPIETISVPNFLEPLTYEERDGKVIVKGKEFSTVLLTVDLTQKNFELNLAPPTNQPSSAP